MKLNFFLILCLILFCNNSFCQSKNSKTDTAIWLTSINKFGDCISPSIYSEKTEFEITLEKDKCKKENKSSKDIAVCIEGVRFNKNSRVFTLYCGDSNYYIGINGETYLVKPSQKYPGANPYLVGRYSNKGLTISIKKTKLIQAKYLDSLPSNDKTMEIYKYEVLIKVKKGNVVKEFKAKANEGI